MIGIISAPSVFVKIQELKVNPGSTLHGFETHLLTDGSATIDSRLVEYQRISESTFWSTTSASVYLKSLCIMISKILLDCHWTSGANSIES